MRLERRNIQMDGESVSAVVAHAASAGSRTVIVLAHGAGNDMHSAFLSAVHTGLAERGYTTVKFNFPYKEQGRRAPDRPGVLQACYRRVLEVVRQDRTIAPERIVIGGKSLGGRMATHLAADGEEVAGVLLLGYPLHPPNKPDQLRTAHLPNIHVPMLFFCGTRDALCRLELLRRVLAELPAAATLHVIDGGDHSFDLPKSMKRAADDVRNEIINTSAEWLARLGSP